MEIDRTVKEHYETLNDQWHNAEEIVTKIDIQRSNSRKISSVVVQANPTPMETTTTRSTLKNVFSKISLPTFDALERKESNISNEVFFEVILYQKKPPSHPTHFLLSGHSNTHCNHST